MKKKPRISYRDLAKRSDPTAEAEPGAPALPAEAPPPTPAKVFPVVAAEVAVAVPSLGAAVVEAELQEVVVDAELHDTATVDVARQHLVVRVGPEWFALPLDAAEEALDVGELHPLPEMGDTMLGVFSLRGALVPLFTPVGPLGVPLALGGAAVVFAVAGGRVAIAVDDVDDVLPIRPSELRRAPFDSSDGVLVGVVRRGRDLIGVLDAAALVGACRAEPVLETV